MNINNLCPHCMREVEDMENLTICPHCGKELKAASQVQHQLKPFSILAGKYMVGDVLGEGGFGITYVGFDLNLEMRVAIKEFYPNGYATREANATTALTVYTGQNKEYVEKWRDNFIKEARSLAKCSHLSGIVGVKDFFQENNTAYIVMEYLEGKTLKSYVKEQGGKVSIDWLLHALEPVMRSLNEVHKNGLIHRDISPDNIMLLPSGNMKLLDFGAARDYSETGEKSLSVMLKPGYAPEEQYRTKGNQGPWSDVYALAGTIYKCITGITPPESMERLRRDELQKPSELGIRIHPATEKALLKGMAVYAEDRFQTVEEFLGALNAGREASHEQTSAVAANEPVETEALSSGEASVAKNKTIESLQDVLNKTVVSIQGKLQEVLQFIKKNPKAAGIAAAVVLCLICVGVFVNVITNDKNDTSVVDSDVMIEDEPMDGDEDPMEEAPASDTPSDAVEENSEADILVENAKSAAESGDYASAISYCEQAKALNNLNEDVYILEADLYLVQDSPEDAARILREGMEITGSEVLAERREYIKENTKIKTEQNTVRMMNFLNEYMYDTNGNPIKLKVTSYDEEGNIEYWTETVYDSNGNPITKITYNADGSIDSWNEYVYDANGNMVKDIFCYEDGTINMWHDYTHDANGNMVKDMFYNADGSIIRWYEYEYDANGNMVKNTYYYEDGTINMWNEYAYDTNGNMIKDTAYVIDEYIDGRYEYAIGDWHEYAYDTNGNMVKDTTYNSDGNISSCTEYEYDNDGLGMYEKFDFDADGNVDEQYYSMLDEIGYLVYKETPHGTTDNTYEYQYFGDIVSFTDNANIHRYELILADATWEQAYADCINRGGYLVHINSYEEFEIITNLIRQENKTSYTFWLGGKQQEENSYRWVNEQGEFEQLELSSRLSYWLPGEPSYYGQDTQGNSIPEEYMDMFYRKSDDRFYWNDVPNDLIATADYLSGRIGYICEYEE